MPSIINSDDGVVSGTSGLKTTGANDGILALQNNGSTAVTVTAARNVGVGTTTPVSPLHVNGGILTITTTGDVIDAFRYINNTSGPAIFLKKSRGASIGTNAVVQNGDTLGVVVFAADYGSGFQQSASIQAVVDGAVSGINDVPSRIEFATSSDGTASNTIRMVIDSKGQVTTPNQAAFSVRGNFTGSVSAGSQLTFTDSTTSSSTQFVFNNGSYWDNTNSRFTAPVAGYYQFNFQIYTQNARTAAQSIAILVNGSQLGATDTVMGYTNNSGSTSNAGDDQGAKGAMMLKLAANDYVTLAVRTGSTTLSVYSGHTYFQGYLIG